MEAQLQLNPIYMKVKAECTRLQEENKVLRQEVSDSGKHRKALLEELDIRAEEMRTLRRDADSEIMRLRIALDEAREARHLEVQALVDQMCNVPTLHASVKDSEAFQFREDARKPSSLGPSVVEAGSSSATDRIVESHVASEEVNTHACRHAAAQDTVWACAVDLILQRQPS